MMTRWEYLTCAYRPADIYKGRATFSRPGYDALAEKQPAEFLDDLGRDGWELIAAPGSSPFGSWTFKRPMVAQGVEA